MRNKKFSRSWEKVKNINLVGGCMGISLILQLFVSKLAWAGKPVVMVYTIGEKDKKVIVEPLAKRAARLRECGYDVVEKTVNRVEDIVYGKEKPSPVLIWVSAHGGILENGEVIPEDEFTRAKAEAPIVSGKTGFHLMKGRETDDVAFDGGAMLTRLKDEFDNPQLFLQACYAGACPAISEVGIGCSSCSTNKTYTFDQTADLIVELLCSGVGDCKEWGKADKNGDGTLVPSDLIHYLAKRLGYQINSILIDASELEAVRKDCESKRGTFRAQKTTVATINFEHEEIVGTEKKLIKQVIPVGLFLQRYNYPNSPKDHDYQGKTLINFRDETHLLENQGLLSYTELLENSDKVKQWLVDHSGKFQTRLQFRRGEKAEMTPLIGLSLNSRDGYKIHCEFRDRPLRVNETYGTFEQPQISSLTLRSLKCREEKLLRRKTGLQLREEIDKNFPVH